MSETLKILTVDDEPLARRIIRRLLKDEPRVREVLEAQNGDEALDLIVAAKPDLVYLDIQMPGCGGFELLERLGKLNLPALPLIIFVTAFDEYALKAFEFHALDYLLKPFDRARFKKSFEMAVRQIGAEKQTVYQERLQRLIDRFDSPQNEYLEWVSLKKDDAISLFKIEEVRWIEAQGNYALLSLSGGASQLLREKMDVLEKKLDPQKFARIHRSAIININYIKEIEVWGRGEHKVVMQGGKVFPVSRSYRDVFNGFLKKVL